MLSSASYTIYQRPPLGRVIFYPAFTMSTGPAALTTATNGVKLGDVSGISIVDFAPFLDGSNKQGVADALLDSFKSVGFAYVVNYGLPKDKVESMFDWVCVVPIMMTSSRANSSLVREVLCAIDGDQDACTAPSIWDARSRFGFSSIP